MLQYFITFFTPLFISLTTLTGVALHETKIDRLTTSVLAIPVAAATTDNGVRGITSDPHTHVERVNIREMRSASPMLAPRYAEQKKHVMQKNVPRGFHHFDHYALLGA